MNAVTELRQQMILAARSERCRRERAAFDTLQLARCRFSQNPTPASEIAWREAGAEFVAVMEGNPARGAA